MHYLIRHTTYFLVTLAIGMSVSLYLLFFRLFQREKERELEERSKHMQPSCLSDPIYGSHKYFKRKGVKIHYVESGSPNSKVVILLHGIPGFWFCWRKQIPELANHFRVIAVDLRGCGDSDHPNKTSSYRREALMQDILSLIDVLGCPYIYLICCETSGYLGWDMALTYPNLVSKLVLINCPHPSILKVSFNAKLYNYIKYWYLLLLQYPVLPELLISSRYESKNLLAPIIGSKSVTEEEQKAYKFTFSRRDDWKGTVNHLKQIDLTPKFLDEQKAILSTPTLMLAGSEHSYLTTELSYRSAELVERISIKIIPKAGINLQVSHSKATNEELMKFLLPFQPIEHVNHESSPSFVARVFESVTSSYRR